MRKAGYGLTRKLSACRLLFAVAAIHGQMVLSATRDAGGNSSTGGTALSGSNGTLAAPNGQTGAAGETTSDISNSGDSNNTDNVAGGNGGSGGAGAAGVAAPATTGNGGRGGDGGTGGFASAQATTSVSTGPATATANANPAGDPALLSAASSGGAGGLGGVPAGSGAYGQDGAGGSGGGGSAIAYSTTSSNALSQATATANGGNGGTGSTGSGGGGGVGGSGGPASVTAQAQSFGSASATATAIGGNGGNGSFGGNGGSATGTAQAIAGPPPAQANVTLNAIGGNGGNGFLVSGAGGSENINDAIYVQGYGPINIIQNATGGNAGSVLAPNASIGQAGNATSDFSFSDVGSTVGPITGHVTATGGNGGNNPFNGYPASGGNGGNAQADFLFNAAQSPYVLGEADAVGGKAGSGPSSGTNGYQGTANAFVAVYSLNTAVAKTVSTGAQASATAVAETSGGPEVCLTSQVFTSAINPNGPPQGTTTGAAAVTFAQPMVTLSPTDNNATISTIAMPTSSQAATETAGTTNVKALLDTPGVTNLSLSKISDIGTIGLETSITTSTSEVTGDLEQPGDLAVGLFNPSYTGDGRVYLQVIFYTTVVYTEQFNTFASAEAFFQDNVVNIGNYSVPDYLNSTFSVNLTIAPNDGTSQFSTELMVATVPEPSALPLLALSGIAVCLIRKTRRARI